MPPLSYVVVKLLMLKLLLACISGLTTRNNGDGSHAYSYGYHPSAEEFDNLRIDNRVHTWTRDLLAHQGQQQEQHRQQSQQQHVRRSWAGGEFVPKFSYERERQRHADMLAWQGDDPLLPQSNQRPQYNQQSHNGAADQLPAAAHVLPMDVAPASFEFTMFSDEVLSAQPPINRPAEYSPTAQIATPALMRPPQPSSQNGVTIIEIASGEISAADQNNGNNKNNSLPIFFTNPATGVVYAITEIGRVHGNGSVGGSGFGVDGANGSIPIYITKQQYDRDMQQLHHFYKKQQQLNCLVPAASSSSRPQTAAKPPSSFSSAPVQHRNTTERPQIIRLQQKPPPSIVSKLPTFELPVRAVPKPKPRPTPSPAHKQPTTSSIVRGDQVKKAPTKHSGVNSNPSGGGIRQQTKRKRKRKNKKTKPPGLHRPPTTVAVVPHVVRGTRTKPKDVVRPSVSTISLHTQLEKPAAAASSTVFSNAPLVSKRGFMSTNKENAALPANHRIRRAAPQKPETVASVVIGDVPGVGPNGTKAARRHTVKTPKTRKTQPRRVPTSGRLPPPKDNRPKGDAVQRWHNALTLAHLAGVFPNNKSNVDKVDISKDVKDIGHTPKDTRGKPKRKNLKGKAKAGGDDDDDLLDLLDELTGSSKQDDGQDEDSYYDDDDDELGVTMSASLKAPKRGSSGASSDNSSSSGGSDDDSDGTSSDDLREDATQSNSSSAEDSADFGALEDEVIAAGDQEEDDEVNIIWSPTASTSTTKESATPSKKRIRRRPASPPKLSKEEYDDEYDDDDGAAGGGVGGFFRMIFYPVQAIMSRFFAADDDDGSDEQAVAAQSQYPTYTLYHNAPNAISAESSEEQGGSSSSGGGISDWFSSWFGFNRREKNIGSTTKAPPVVVPHAAPPTQRPSSWWESWFGFGTSGESESNSYEDDYDKWFSSWFDTKPKGRRRTTTTTPVAPAAAMPQVPILTIVDPLRNPQNWIGILAHHLANATATSTTTHNPLLEAFHRATSTVSSVDPDIPRRITYDKYQIWRLKPQDDAQVQSLDEYKDSEEGHKLQWLKGPSLRGLTDVLVPPKMLIDFRSTLNFDSIAYEVLIFDVGKAIAYEKSKEAQFPPHSSVSGAKAPNRTQQVKTGTSALMNWHKYYEYDVIIKYVERLRMKHPQLVELIHIGRSYEGRPLIIVKLEQSNGGAVPNTGGGAHKKLKYRKKSGHANAVFIEAGTHGVEWIGPAAATWMINEVLRIMRSNKTSAEHDFIRKTTWYIMPVLNPDGYVYAHEYDRFWRKTRSRHVNRADGLLDSAMSWLQQKRLREQICYGVDLDRNWAYQWGTRGSSKTACNEFYSGPMPFSEPESKALSEFLMEQRKRIKLFISLQAYGQVISFPIRANASFTSERMDDFLDVAMVGTDGLRKKGSKARYKVDTTSDLMEHRSGCSDAFAAYEVGVPFTFTLQLADNGVHGYLLPGSSIEPTARDVFEIVTAMLDYI